MTQMSESVRVPGCNNSICTVAILKRLIVMEIDVFEGICQIRGFSEATDRASNHLIAPSLKRVQPSVSSRMFVAISGSVARKLSRERQETALKDEPMNCWE